MILFLPELWTHSVDGQLLQTSQKTEPDEAAALCVLGVILGDISEFTGTRF